MAITTKADGTLRDKEDKSYVNSPSRGVPYSAQEVVIGNSVENPVPVDPTTRGTSEAEYNEVQALTGGEITIINLTVPASTEFDLQGVECSGDNIAHFIIEINGSVKYKKRTWWADFNLDIDLTHEVLNVGDNIKVKADNQTNSAAFFNATLKYNEVSL
jgi:hypothetical protein